MQIIKIAYKYLKRRPRLALAALFSIIIASFFEGASFSMLIPLMQTMISKSPTIFGDIPLLVRIIPPFLFVTQVRMVSFIFISIFILLSVKNVFLYISYILISKLRFGAIRDFRTDLMNNLLEYDIKFFDNAKIGHIIGNIDAETQRMGDFIRSALDLIVFSGRVCAYILLLSLISWKASAAIFLLIAVILPPIEIIMKKVKKMGALTSEAIADYTYKLTELLGGIRLIKLSGTESEEKEEFRKKADKVYSCFYRGNKYMNLIEPLSEVAIFALIVASFLFIINVIKIDLLDTFPYIAAYLLVLARTLTQLNGLNRIRSNAINNLAAFTRYEEMLDNKGKTTIISGHRKPDMFTTSIEFKNVNFGYGKGNDKEVLENVTIAIPKGKMTALVGVSGAGKSTIANLIVRFYDINSGSILVDGLNLKDLALKEWRKKIGFVSQDIFVFNTSVKDNIAYGHSGVSGEQIIDAAKAANAHDFIVSLPDGYDTILGERGVKLSGGQKQRLSIARAIIHNPEILILDEATSSLDSETEKLITQALNKLTRDRTVIAIAHRLSTVLHADHIVVLDNGRVLESGRHEDLIKKSGLYNRLFEAQFTI